MQKSSVIIVIILIIACFYSSAGFAAVAKKEKKSEPELVTPDVVWLSPVFMQVKTKSKKPKAVPVVFKINIRDDGFDNVCKLVPEIVDAINLEFNGKIYDYNLLSGKKKTDFLFGLAKLIKEKFSLQKDIYYIEAYRKMSDLNSNDKIFYDRCNKLPSKLIR